MSTVAMALYVWLTMPSDDTARTVGIVGTVAWYVLTYQIVKRVTRQLSR